MNEENLKKLPKALQKLISEGVWEEKVGEIAKKYSLNETQTENLINLVLFFLLGIDEKKDLTETIASELETSGLLAEQLKNDIEKRVLEYAIKIIDDYDKGSSIEEKIKNVLTKASDGDFPELRPEITPMVEPEEKVRTRPVPVGFTGVTPAPKPQAPTPELVQRPVSVPRYTAVPVEEGKNESVVQKNTTPTGTPRATTPTEPTKTPEPIPEPVKKYTVDPYREPLE